MVKVRVERSRNKIQQIEIYDHAGYADAGFDLVCAGVSSIAVGMLNALDHLAPDVCSFTMEKAYVKVRIEKSSDAGQLLLEAMLVQLMTLQESYQSYIRIKEQEV